MKEVTVVIPNYNGMKYLPECMASLCQGQENAPEYEVLIIDNGSADGSVDANKDLFLLLRNLAEEKTGHSGTKFPWRGCSAKALDRSHSGDTKVLQTERKRRGSPCNTIRG